MPGPTPTVGELFKAKAVTDEQMSALINAILAGKLDDRAELAEGYVLDVAAAVKANAFATAVLADEMSKSGARRNAAQTAILLEKAQKA